MYTVFTLFVTAEVLLQWGHKTTSKKTGGAKKKVLVTQSKDVIRILRFYLRICNVFCSTDAIQVAFLSLH